MFKIRRRQVIDTSNCVIEFSDSSEYTFKELLEEMFVNFVKRKLNEKKAPTN